jgi:Rieske Fe-S protein
VSCLKNSASFPSASSRRSFVKLFALFAASSMMERRKWAANVLAQAHPLDVPDAGLLRLKLSDFPTLKTEFGSVRIGTSPIGPDNRPVGLFYPVIITRGANSQFYALDSSCTHEGCTVPTFDSSLQYMQCPCHGSQYFIDGKVRRGPANFALRQFVLHYDGADSLAVELPDISFALEVVQVQPGAGRIQLQFIAFDQLQYEVRFRPNATADWSKPVPFSLTLDGPADQTVITGHADYAEVYLDRSASSGFYAITMQTKPV